MHYKKTELGQFAFQNRSVSLTPRQRSAFILFDGKRSVEDVLKATTGLGVVMDDINMLVVTGMLELAGDSALLPMPLIPLPRKEASPTAVVSVEPRVDARNAPSSRSASQGPSAHDQAHYSRAYPIATRLTAGLGLRGFRLNLAVETASDLAKLRELAPKIREAVGPEKFSELDDALYD